MSAYPLTGTFGHSYTARPADRWTAVFQRDALVHAAMMASIIAGTFQGYLKDRMASALPYVLAEVFFVAGAAFWLCGLALRRSPIRGPTRVLAIVLTLVLVPALYVLHPETPLVVELAGLRGWSEFPVACLIALTAIRSPGQVRAYVGLILLLCAVTALYGIAQYRAGPAVALGASELAQIRHGSTVFYEITSTGQVDFRAFSTFTFPAPFALMMVFGILLAAGIALSAQRSRRGRLVAGALIPLFFAGIAASGTRAAVLILLIGLLLVCWYSRFSLRSLFLLPVLLIGVMLATFLTSHVIIGRWQSVVTQEGLFWTYGYAPITIAARALAEHPLGMGLGRSGVGVPFAIMRTLPSDAFTGSDGDIGRAAVEMGVFGVMLLALIVFGLLPQAARAVRRLGHTRMQDLSLGMGPLIIATGVGLLIGSPLSSVPHATVWWFFLGALLKLSTLEEDERSA
jgi:hypothetical protein